MFTWKIAYRAPTSAITASGAAGNCTAAAAKIPVIMAAAEARPTFHFMATQEPIFWIAPWSALPLTTEPRSSSSKPRSEEHTSELQSLMRISYAVLCLKKNKQHNQQAYSTY